MVVSAEVKRIHPGTMILEVPVRPRIGGCMPKNSRITGLLLFLVGFMALLASLGKPRVAALHGADILGLIACGFCFGVGFAGLLGRLRFRKE